MHVHTQHSHTLILGSSSEFLCSIKSQWTFSASKIFLKYKIQTETEIYILQDCLQMMPCYHVSAFSLQTLSAQTSLYQGSLLLRLLAILSERPDVSTECSMLYPTLPPAAAFLRCRSLPGSGQVHFLSLANCLAESPATLEWQFSVHSKDLPVTGKQNTAILLNLLPR